QVGGDLVTVDTLTPPGAEPHDVELSPRQVRQVGEADVVVVLGGFQPSVDEAVAAREPAHLVDAAATDAVAAHLGEVAEAEHAEEFAARAEEVDADLTELDETIAAGLADCDRDVIVAAHEAYGFLAERYGLEQAGISGLDPDAEPSPARLREIGDIVAEHGVT